MSARSARFLAGASRSTGVIAGPEATPPQPTRPTAAAAAAAAARETTQRAPRAEGAAPASGAPYSWSTLRFARSTDQGPEAGGRNFADGGGWGLCEGMCPEGEIHERINIAPNANMHELDAETGLPRLDRLVTMFHRNDAARVWQPSDIRSVNALAASIEHLVTEVIERRFVTSSGAPCPHVLDAAAWAAGDPPFYMTQNFIRDRLRQVRQELTMQMGSFSLDAKKCAVDLMEVCTRFHIMVGHRCCELGTRNFAMNDVRFDEKMNSDMFTQVPPPRPQP